MKNFKVIIVLVLGILASSCSMEENPITLDTTLYNNPQSATGALDGIYSKIATYNTQERRLYVINGFSGMFNSKKNGNNITNVNNANLFSLKPVLDADTEAMWGGLYNVIAQTNAVITYTNTTENATTTDELTLNDIKGQAYFARGWAYFSLVRLFGDIPLWLELPSSEKIHAPKTSAKEVYAQIISDAIEGANLINGQSGIGYPKQYAANMLLAKVYMTLATNSSLHDGSLTEMDYWQMAYNEAIKGYGQYTLVANYSSLFTDSGGNSSESIFELQISQEAANSQMGRNYTPSRYKLGQAFGWLKVNASVYDQHATTYPNDPRIDGTYLYDYINIKNGKPVKTYPANAGRPNYNAGHPFLFKFAEKDTQNANQYNSQNIVIYRYAELLIMLAEISNELQNGKQLGYVEELLTRVEMQPHAGYLGSKEEFRDAIMNEYRFELIGEGEDAHNNRRRGYDYFLNHTILTHNNSSLFKAGVDLTLSTDQNQVMMLPIPQKEIDFNELID